jgi:hypothetical protein
MLNDAFLVMCEAFILYVNRPNYLDWTIVQSDWLVFTFHDRILSILIG